MASKFQQILNTQGFNIASIDTWTGNKAQKTRIYVKEDGMGQDIKDYFSDAEIIKRTGRDTVLSTDIIANLRKFSSESLNCGYICEIL